MEGQDHDVPGNRGYLFEEDVKMPSNAAHANRLVSTPGRSGQVIHQGNSALSLLLSPPPTSPLIPLDTIDSSPLQEHSTAQPLGPRFTGITGSPRRLVQPADLPEFRELPQGPFVGSSHYPRETYVPPGINDLMPQTLPSSSPTLSPNNTQRGRGSSRGLDCALDHSEDYLRQTYLPNDGSPYGYHHDQHQQSQECVPGPETLPVSKQEEDSNDNDEDHLCEFAAPCRMHPSPDGMHYRKVVSHVFGRNKAVTKLFPLGVWVHYCRKHYQRARYRADQWPFTQCDLLLESLSRMESWDGVDSFELILRRREQMRVGRETEGTPTTETSKKKETYPSANQAQDQDNKSSGVTTQAAGRKHPTAIIAPVPDWLRQHVGHGKTFQEIRRIIEMVRNHMVRLRNQERAQQQLNHIPKSPSAPHSPRRGAPSNGRRGRIAKPASRDPLRLRASTVRFPDVEILPHFKPWVKEAALRQRSATNCPKKEGGIKDYGAEQRVSGGGYISGEIQDPCDGNARAESSQPTNGQIATNSTTPCPAQHSDSISTTEMAEANLLQMQPHIGRAGTNRGQSESQRRRSERVYIRALDRVPGQGSTKKHSKDSDK
ncbi:hypothetical protein PITC_067100 [Penicillium italicum]|uniref:ORP1 like protein n=1 Tax=Penicillium italicum TaxID=40296 RepID=A0A0A2KF37_PENIT|nr:hypothetical protein PITC_067100 [Penicillium italicum]